jgi:hypothetical protein
VLVFSMTACRADPPPAAPTETVTVPPQPRSSSAMPPPAPEPVSTEPPFELRSEPIDLSLDQLQPSGPPGMAPFDRGAAAQALSQVNVTSCKRGSGVTGSGHVTVTFNPDGRVAMAVVDQGPFPGTAEGACIASKYRLAQVPPFSGAPVRVGKSFTIP